VGTSPNRLEAASNSIDDPAVRRWLHDKYERLAAEEGSLAASRTSYFATIGTVLITGLVVAIDYFTAAPRTLLLVATFLAGLGIAISLVWAVLLHRTLDAQSMWREAIVELEQKAPPIAGELPGTITLRSGATMPVNLLLPYTTHRQRFADDRAISWMDRLTPGALSEVLPVFFLLLWCAVLVAVWIFIPY
jgi:hypothetical protein